MLYNMLIAIYALAVRIAGILGNIKARAMLKGQKETFHVLSEKLESSRSYIWIHVASLGEFEQGRPLIEQIKSEYPQDSIILSFFSPSGYEVRKNYPLADIVCYLPFDTPSNAKRFVDLIKPKMAIFVKYEFWHNYLTQLHKQQIPTFIVSAIFRPSQPFFKWYGKKSRTILTYYKQIFVQDATSQELLATIGVENVVVCGDTRFDRVQSIADNSTSIPEVEVFLNSSDSSTHNEVVVAGSTWTNDEKALAQLLHRRPHMKLIVAPHEITESHLQELEKIFPQSTVYLSRATQTMLVESKCLIIDRIGLLSKLYRYADIAYIGGGFGAGIHNILEAAVYGKPIVFGPNYHKFKEAVDLVAREGAYSVSSPKYLPEKLELLLMDSRRLQVSGQKAAAYVNDHIGATDRIMNCLRGSL